jgi:hypothetical protein
MTSVLVNGRMSALAGPPNPSLLGFLRGGLGLTGTKPGCGEGGCGACTVLVDGAPVLARGPRAHRNCGIGLLMSKGASFAKKSERDVLWRSSQPSTSSAIEVAPVSDDADDEPTRRRTSE